MAEEKNEKTKEQLAEEWKAYVRDEVNAHLDAFLDIASEGTIGIKYDFVDKAVYEDGSAEPDIKQASGVNLVLKLNFETPLFFTDEEGYTE
jgi:hypothetical protein